MVDLTDDGFHHISRMMIGYSRKYSANELIFKKLWKFIYDFLTKKDIKDDFRKVIESPELITKYNAELIKFENFLKSKYEYIDITRNKTWFEIEFGNLSYKKLNLKRFLVNEKKYCFEIVEKDYFSIVDDIQSVENGIVLFFDALKKISEKLYNFCIENTQYITFKIPNTIGRILEFHDSIVIHYHSDSVDRNAVTAIFKKELELKNIFKKRVLRKKTGVDVDPIDSHSSMIAKILMYDFIIEFVNTKKVINMDPNNNKDIDIVKEFFKKEYNIICSLTDNELLNRYVIVYDIFKKSIADYEKAAG